MARISDNNDDDDIFDESINEKLIGEREWIKIKSDLLKEGFRDGVSEGQESQIQSGFNSGYKLASRKLFQMAQLRGEISAIISCNHLNGGKMSYTTIDQFNQLIQDIRKVEDMLLKPSKDELGEVMVKEGQGHLKEEMQKLTNLSSAETLQQSTEMSDDTKTCCGNASSCGSKTYTQEQCCNSECKCTNENVVKEEITPGSIKDLNPCNDESLLNSGEKDSVDCNVLLHIEYEKKVTEFKERLKNIHTMEDI